MRRNKRIGKEIPNDDNREFILIGLKTRFGTLEIPHLSSHNSSTA